jgi:hypothetical protein
VVVRLNNAVFMIQLMIHGAICSVNTTAVFVRRDVKLSVETSRKLSLRRCRQVFEAGCQLQDTRQ